MRMIDQIRDKCIEVMEEQYMARLELLVNEEQYEDARPLFLRCQSKELMMTNVSQISSMI